MKWLVIALLLLAPAQAVATDFLVVYPLDDVLRGALAANQTAGTDSFASFDPTTTALDAMAANGTRFTGVVSAPRCTNTRATLYTGFHIRHSQNLMARTLPPEFPSSHSVEVSPFMNNIFRELDSAGWGTIFYGKWDVGTIERISRGMSPSPIAWGIDEAPIFIGAESMVTLDAQQEGSLGPNYWIKATGDGDVSIETSYRPLAIKDAVLAKIAALKISDPTGKYAIFVAFKTPHSPWCFGVEDTTGCSNDVTGAGTFKDDRKSGSSAASFNAVYLENIETIDSYIGLINAEIDLGGTGIAIAVGDNGLPWGALSAEATPDPVECETDRSKGTFFPCGADALMVARGSGITSGGVVSSLLDMTDVAHTIVDLAGGSFASTDDGRSFADCMTSSNGWTPSTCWERSFVEDTEFRPLGGNTDGSIQRICLPDDPLDEWDDCVYTLRTKSYNSHYLLRREYDADIATHSPLGFNATDFCEQFYDIDDSHATNRYLPSAVSADAETSCVSPMAGAIDPATLAGDQKLALEFLQGKASGMLDRSGALAPTFSGVIVQ